jgi:hypothetical protein
MILLQQVNKYETSSCRLALNIHNRYNFPSVLQDWYNDE